jgi:hypothetical protein
LDIIITKSFNQSVSKASRFSHKRRTFIIRIEKIRLELPKNVEIGLIEVLNIKFSDAKAREIFNKRKCFKIIPIIRTLEFEKE